MKCSIQRGLRNYLFKYCWTKFYLWLQKEIKKEGLGEMRCLKCEAENPSDMENQK